VPSQNASYMTQGWFEKVQNTKSGNKRHVAGCDEPCSNLARRVLSLDRGNDGENIHEMSIPVGNKIRYFPTIGELERLRNPKHLTTQRDRAMSNDDPMKKRFFKKLPSRLLNLYGAYTKLKISLFHRSSRLSNFMNGIICVCSDKTTC